MSTFKTAETRSTNVNGTKFVYRELGIKGGVPIVFLHHLTAVLEDWDPRIVDGLAARHHVIIFDNRGVGGSEGSTPTTVEEMADDAVGLIRALCLKQVDLFGFSLGGFVSQVILQKHPKLVRKAILAGTGPAGGAHPHDNDDVGTLLQGAFARAFETGKHPKHFLFFRQSEAGQEAADHFLARLSERTEDRDSSVADATVGAQLAAISAWGHGDSSGLASVTHPVLVANGDDDVMVPTLQSFELARLLPNSQLSILPDAGHGGIFQHHDVFVKQALDFLR
jgi:pimeloyl-ACP methyl ester carboxylesterase